MIPPTPSNINATDGITEPPTSVALGHLLQFVKPFAGHIVLGVVFAFGARGLVLVIPQLTSRIIDASAGQVDPTALNATGALFLASIVGVAVFQFLGGVLFAYIGERMVMALRHAVFQHVMSLSVDFFERRRVGEVMSRVSTDSAVIRELGTDLPITLVTHVVTVIGVLGIVLVQQPDLTAILVGFLPFIVLAAIPLGRIVRRLALENMDNIALGSVAVEEGLSGITTVKAFARESAEVDRYGRRLADIFRSGMKLSVVREGMRLISVSIVYGGMAAITWIATGRIVDGSLTSGELVAFMMYALIAGHSFAALAALWARWERMRGIAVRLEQIFRERPTVVDGPNPVPFDGTHETISFENVHFAYPTEPDRMVLKGLDFTFERGQHIALVGESGAGKSTIAALLLRLYDVTEGSISIDGVDLRSMVQNDLRRVMGVVPQDVIVFGRSVRENLTYGNREATDAEILDAARAANALDFVQAMPRGLDTVLGERGVTISGGQRQRLAIARAILKDPAILILDEATSALDKPSEEAVRDALATLMEDRTTFVIAHRLATIEGADRVLVLNEGLLVESGTHAELLAMRGHYARLYQMGAWAEAEIA